MKSAEQAKQAVASAKAAGYDVLKTHGGLGRAVYDTVVAAAGRAGLPLVGHVTPDIALAHALEVGQQVEHLHGYLLAAVRDGAVVPPFYRMRHRASGVGLLGKRRVVERCRRVCAGYLSVERAAVSGER